jgi:phosphoenolpyruvate carboxykinase (ATP)
MLNAALNGTLGAGEFNTDPNFGLLVPASCPGVPNDVLQPKSTWQDEAAYDVAAQEVAGRFEKNFNQFEGHVSEEVMATIIRSAA